MTSDLPFGEMKRINAPRDIAVHTASALDQLVSVGNDIIERYHPATNGISKWEEHHEIYTAIEAELADTMPNYDTSDLQGLVTAYSNKDDSTGEVVVRGMYTGALASVLTKRNYQKGLSTRIYLNGNNDTFPFLFFFAKTLDEVTIENYRGAKIAAYAAYKGTANNITLSNITGNFIGTKIASNGGYAGTVTLANITGNWAGTEIARYGLAGVVTFSHINEGLQSGLLIASGGYVGTVTFAHVTGFQTGGDIAAAKGYAGTITFSNVIGEEVGSSIASSGHAGAIIFSHITGDYCGRFIGRYIHTDDIGIILVNDIDGKTFLDHEDRKIIRSDKLAKKHEIQALIDQLSQPDCAPQHYAQASEQLGKLLRKV